MAFVDGTVLDTPAAANAALADQALRVRATSSLVDALSRLHALDVDAIGLGELGRREDYVLRQLRTLHRIWERSKTRELPIVDSLHARLGARVPPQRRTALVHCDYRFGNVILGANGEIAAVLDWELCAIGDPLADLAFLLCSHEEPDEAEPSIWMVDAPTRAGGFPRREWVIERYVRSTGATIADLDYFRAFAYWRLAVIAEGIKRRYLGGAMGAHADTAAIEERVRRRAARADEFLRRAEATSPMR